MHALVDPLDAGERTCAHTSSLAECQSVLLADGKQSFALLVPPVGWG
jgi:hypothetical protein